MNKKLLVFMLLTIVLSGCWDENQPERMLYVNGVGVDYKDGKYDVYVQFANFANLGKTDQPDSDVEQAEVGHAQGDTPDEAIHELYNSSDQRVYWGHFSYLVVSEEAMKNGKLDPVIDLLTRFKETRYHVWVYTTKDSIEDVLLVRPVLNKAIILSKLGDPENSFEQESFVEPLNIRNLLIGLDEPSHEAMIPLISLKENWKTAKEPIKQTVLSGVCVVTPNSFKGFITGDKARGIQWMSNEMKRGHITFKLDGGNYFTMVINNLKVKIKPIVSNGDVAFDIDVKLKVTVSTMGENVTSDTIQKEIKKEVEKEIMATYEEALKKDIDIYHFSEKLYRKDVKEWKKHEKDGSLELTKDSIRNLKITISKLDSDRKSFKKTID